jgi:hypothetical protein
VLVNLAGGRNKKSVPRGATCAQLLRPLRRADGPRIVRLILRRDSEEDAQSTTARRTRSSGPINPVLNEHGDPLTSEKRRRIRGEKMPDDL